MSLLFPLGLLALLAIPVLIIIYIIKNKYTEQVVTSTYLWTLSEKFLKRKNPINIITGLISLILQIIAVICIAFAIAHPVFTLPGAAFDYCFILDGSGSMNIVQDDSTRLEQGKKEIRSIIKSSVNGSAYTLVYVGDTADVMFEGVNDKDRALLLLDEIQPKYCESADLDALTVAGTYFEENRSIKTYLITDKTYEQHENVEIIYTAKEAVNYSLSDLQCVLSDEKLNVSGNVVAYGKNAEITLQMFIDDSDVAEAEQKITATEEPAEFTFVSDSVNYRSVKVCIAESDALALDNQSIVYNLGIDSTYKTLIVSDTPFFIKAVLGVNNITVCSPKDYSTDYLNYTGYGLYVFDSYSPDTVPSDGAVWFFNPTKSSAHAGFTFLSEESDLYAPVLLSWSTNSASSVTEILKNTQKKDILLNQYVKCGLNRNFVRLLTYSGNPIVFAGTNDYGNREVVFAFSLHETDIALTSDFVILTKNLLDYTFPPVLEASSYYCGESVRIHVPANCNSIRIDTPLGGVAYLDTGVDSTEYKLDEVGVYTITLLTDSSERVVYVYSDLPLSERNVRAEGAAFSIIGEAENNGRDGVYNDLLYLFILLAVIFLADWMVYCYEQYQLR